jgi:hypothetical protein
MENSFYLPILKSKDGEFTALSYLDDFTRKYTVPLFEITPIEYDKQTGKKPKTIQEHLFNFSSKRFMKKWCSSNCFIDAYYFDGKKVDGQSCLEYIYSLFYTLFDEVNPIIPAPVARIKSSDEALAAIVGVITSHKIQELGLRITIEDITAAGFNNQVTGLLKKLNFTAGQVHLILDLASSNFEEAEDFSDAIIAVLDGFPFLQEWKSFTICGGAFPQTTYLKKGVNRIVRNDWKFFHVVKEKLAEETFSRPINYGDYGVVSPGYFEFDPKRMSRSANIRYTLSDIWFVVKGSAIKGSTDYDQYVSQAKIITDESFYSGQDFSKGDLQLKHCAQRFVAPGTPTVWNWAGNNHHFTKVVKDLFSNPHVA